MDGYDVCQRGKALPEMLAGKLLPNPIPNMPWTDISVDFVMGLLEAQGYDAILIAKFSYNNKIQKSTKISPFYANYRFNPRMGFEP